MLRYMCSPNWENCHNADINSSFNRGIVFSVIFHRTLSHLIEPNKTEIYKSETDFPHMVENKAKSSPKLNKAINFDTIPRFT